VIAEAALDADADSRRDSDEHARVAAEHRDDAVAEEGGVGECHAGGGDAERARNGIDAAETAERGNIRVEPPGRREVVSHPRIHSVAGVVAERGAQIERRDAADGEL
jgi:hypothetical protein